MTRKIAFIWRKNSDNVGDRNSGWPLYFDFPLHDQLDLDEVEHNRISLDAYSHVIIGGGLYPEQRWYPHIHRWIETTNAKILAIGVGRNDQSAQAVGRNERIVWRHCGQGEICPCPSCMAKIFDKQSAPTCRAVAYENRDIAALAEHALPTMENRGCSMAEAVEFLAAGEKVLTSSYHGAYWAKLLGRDLEVISERGKMNDPIWEYPIFNLECCREIALLGYDYICEFLEDRI